MKSNRKKRKKVVAYVGDGCTGCGASPVCLAWCPIDGALVPGPAEDAYPFGRVTVDPGNCTGCGGCVTRGYEGAFTQGCPWNAITLIPLDDAPALEESREDARPALNNTASGNQKEVLLAR